MIKKERAAGIVLQILLVAVVLLVGGCGYKNSPVPPERVVPTPINDLRYTVDTKGVELTWSYPVETIKGTSIEEIDSFEVYRAVVPVADYCGGCPVPFGKPVVLPGGETAKEMRRKSSYEESLLRPGHKYFYKVRSRRSWWAASGDSNIVSFVWHTPANAPEDLSVTVEGKNAVLSWTPVTTFVDGSQIDLSVTYQVLRSEGGKGFKSVGTPVSATQFVDGDVVNGKKYFYKVQSLIAFEGESAKGAMSEIVDVVPKDVTPPAQVIGVTAVRAGAGIKVIWDRSNDFDVAGYRVYRRLENQETLELIGEIGSSYTIFSDEKVPANVRVFYSVTAVDDVEPANESVPSEEATLRY